VKEDCPGDNCPPGLEALTNNKKQVNNRRPAFPVSSNAPLIHSRVSAKAERRTDNRP